MPGVYFAPRYFAPRYFAPRYFAGVATVAGTLAAYSGVVTIYPAKNGTIDIASTNVIELSKFLDTIGGAYPTDATVTATLYVGSSLTPVPNAIDLPLAHVANTTGALTLYRGELPASVAATLLIQAYVLIVTAVDANGKIGVFYEPVSAVKRA